MDKKRLLDVISTHVRYTFSRSSGPGGQNVNKVNTKVSARLPLSVLSAALSEREVDRLRDRLSGRVTVVDEIVVHVQEERSQSRNREIATTKIISLVLHALSQKKVRRPSSPTRGSRIARLTAKRRRGLLKAQRRKGDWLD